MSEEFDNDQKRIDDAIGLLSEHFDSVSIFATKHDSSDSKTFQFSARRGNVHANYGWVKQFVLDFEEYSKERARINAQRHDEE